MLSAEVQAWCGTECDYGQDFLGEELAGSGGDLCYNEHASIFMNAAIDVFPQPWKTPSSSASLSGTSQALKGLICSLLLNNIK